ncbi:lipase family alpha/beta hydrolase [Haliangium ochraceum]|nr:alpha/beta fold hydrolase [Haliangium ochraceum]
MSGLSFALLLLVTTALVALVVWAATRSASALPPRDGDESAAHPAAEARGGRDQAAREARAQAVHAAAPPYPIVLVHGFLGWAEIQVFGRRYRYFRGIADVIEDTGAPLHVVTLPPLGSIARRAEVLVEAVRALDAERVHLIAHSMGGLDARYAIARLGLSDKVASLVTIGTPHRGTPLARFGDLRVVSLLRRALARAGFPDDASVDLTPERMAEFNAEVRDQPGVYYASVIGCARLRSTNPALWAGWALMARAGTSDGIVPVSSQRWGEVIAEVFASHWAQIGWSMMFDARALYRQLASRLRARELAEAPLASEGARAADVVSAGATNRRQPARLAAGDEGAHASPPG